MRSDASFMGPVNLGNPREFTINGLSELVIELTGSRSKIIYLSCPRMPPQQRRPDIAPANNHLDWQPKVALREGLAETLAYFDVLLSRMRLAPPHAHESLKVLSLAKGYSEAEMRPGLSQTTARDKEATAFNEIDT